MKTPVSKQLEGQENYENLTDETEVESSILDLLQGLLCKQHPVPLSIACYFFFLLHQALLKPEQEHFLQELSVESLAFLQQFLVPQPE